jgi:polysaccharide export outer membrane protein
MRKLVLFGAMLATAMTFCGCGKKEPPAAKLGEGVDVVVPNYRGKIYDPGEAMSDPDIGPLAPPVAQVYHIRTGDELEVGVWGEDDMTKHITVGPDGRISYFLATEILASGRTVKQLKTRLRQELKKQFKDPEVFVSLVNSAGNFVSVTGVVRRPGLYKISNESRLVDVIAQAGGIPLGTSRFGENFAEIADLTQSFVIRGHRFLDVDFEKLFGRKRASAREIALNNVIVQPKDRVYIAPAIRMDNKVFVVGAVRAPRVVHFSGKISFLEAIVQAGDVPEAAWERKSFIVRGRMNKPKIIPVNAREVRVGRIADIQLQAGDVVFVPKTPLAKTVEVIRQLDTIFSGITSAERASKVKMFDR